MTENYSVKVIMFLDAENKDDAISKARSILNKAERHKFGFLTDHAELLEEFRCEDCGSVVKKVYKSIYNPSKTICGSCLDVECEEGEKE